MAKAEEISLRGELLRFLYKEPYDVLTITAASGDRYTIHNPSELAVGESVVSVEPADGSHSFFRLQQISNIDVKAETRESK